MVRLLQQMTVAFGSQSKVSIPQWCDCCPLIDFIKHAPVSVSIPQWCDCCSDTEVVTVVRVEVSIPQWCDCCPEIQKAERDFYAAFQSHNGAIAASAILRSMSSRSKFQSHNGAIAARLCLPKTFGKDFVSIPQWCDCCAVEDDATEGSIVVSIPQWCDCCIVQPFAANRPSCVSIPQWCDCCISSVESIKASAQFQSHNGAIAAINSILRQVVSEIGFNPTMVRLLLKWLAQTDYFTDKVSIPQWCDCCPQTRTSNENVCFGFNPTMVRLLHLRKLGR